MNRVAVAVLVVVVAGCVSTRNVSKGSNPDPRAGLPPVLTQQQKEAQKKAQEAAQEAAKPVLQLSAQDPIIDVRVVFRTGSADDPAGQEGLTNLAVHLMRLATVDKDSAAFSDALFPMAAELGAGVDKDTVVFSGRCHRDHKDAFFKLFTDVILHPRLDAADFERVKAEETSALTSVLRSSNDEWLQREALEAALYDAPNVLGLTSTAATSTARHPYRHTPTGTVEGLASITLDDVKAWVGSALASDRVVVGVAGGADEAFVAALTKALSTLPTAKTARAPVAAPVSTGGNKLLVVEKPAQATAISLGFVLPELSRTHPDYAAMKLAETWFGEHRSLIGHLFNSMRETRGLNYGDYAYVEHFVQEGWSTFEELNIPRRSQYFSMWIRPVEHKNRLFALRMTAWELARFVDQGIPSDVEFEKVRGFVSGYWRSKEQDPMRRLGYAVDERLTGQPFDRDGLRAKVKSLTRAEVNAAIQRHLHKDNVVYVVVTEDAKGLVDDVVGKKPAAITYSGKMSDAVLEEDKGIVVFDLGVDADDVVVVPPSRLFQQ